MKEGVGWLEKHLIMKEGVGWLGKCFVLRSEEKMLQFYNTILSLNNKVRMKQIFITLLLLLGAAGTVSVSAQSTWANTSDDQYNAEVRQTLNLDYSMPDYHTGKIDPKVMGPRLALLLQELCTKYKESVNNSYLSTIQCQQIEGLDYCTIKGMKLDDVSKTGDIITISFKTTLDKNPLNIKKSELTISFVNGVSESKYGNSLFMTISKYLKE